MSDDKDISVEFTGFDGLHPSYLLDLKRQNAFVEKYLEIEKESKKKSSVSIRV